MSPQGARRRMATAVQVTDIIASIEAATASVCGWCQTPLKPDSSSPDFCSELHQSCWHTHHRDPRVLAAPTGDRDESIVAHLPVTMRLEVDTAAFVERMAALQALFADVARIFAESLTASFRATEQAFRGMRAAYMIEDEAPADPKARALALRRSRNTGPAIHRRAPKRIDATRTRR